MTSLMENIYRRMNQLEISQAELAKRIGKPRSTVNGWINSNYEPKTAEAVAIAKALNTSVEYLITGETEGKSSTRVTIERYLDRFTDAELVRIQSILETVFPEKEDDTQQGQKKGGKLQDHSA